jgi:hypothetical protein
MGEQPDEHHSAAQVVIEAGDDVGASPTGRWAVEHLMDVLTRRGIAAVREPVGRGVPGEPLRISLALGGSGAPGTPESFSVTRPADRSRTIGVVGSDGRGLAYAVLDLADVATAATLRTAALALRGDTDDRYAGAFAPWAVIPGLTLGTTRLVPYSAIQAGLEARQAAAGKTANEAAAGEHDDAGLARYAIGLSQAAWSDADRELLNDAGVNVARVMFGGVRTYGYRTLVDPLGQRRDWLALSNARLNMQIAALANEIAEDFEFRQIDGAKHTISQFGGALAGMLLPFWETGALFGETFDDAALVDVGDKVMTGQPIGFVGDTGRASECHLHFEEWTAPGWYDGGEAFDPLRFLKVWDGWS